MDLVRYPVKKLNLKEGILGNLPTGVTSISEETVETILVPDNPNINSNSNSNSNINNGNSRIMANNPTNNTATNE